MKSFDIVSKLSKPPTKRKPHSVHRCHLGVESKMPNPAHFEVDNALVPPCLKKKNGDCVVDEIDKLSLAGEEGIKQVRIIIWDIGILTQMNSFYRMLDIIPNRTEIILLLTFKFQAHAIVRCTNNFD